MSFPSHIFKAYDIRGLVEGELSTDLAYRVGRSFAIFLKTKGYLQNNRQVVVGQDMRATSPIFADAVVEGITDEGVSVIDIGLATTPLFNFACANYKEYAGGIMITASHNPAAYNGFKMTLDNGLPIGKASGMSEIRDMVEKSLFTPNPIKGTRTDRNVLKDYLKRVMSLVDVSKIKPLKVVLDAGNGMGKVTFVKLLEQLPVTVDYLYLEPDGTFPNHEANPLKVETLEALQKRVVETGADFGFALDGDADRVGLVDEKGQVVDASFVGALVGLEVLRSNPDSKLYYDLRSSMIVPEVWQAAGGTVEMCEVGHALIKKKLKDKGGIFASELSLHLYFHDMYDVESTDLSLLLIMQMLSRENKPLSELVAPLKKYSHSGEINFEIHDKDRVLKILEEKYAASAAEVSRLDGLWMRFDWGWFSVRASNTEPVLRLNTEARGKDMLSLKLEELKKIITA